MKITISEIRNIIKEELQKFLEKEKKTCRQEYLDCGNTVPCFDKFLECEEEAVFRGVKAFRADKAEKAELARIEKEKQAEFEKMQREEQERIAKGIHSSFNYC